MMKFPIISTRHGYECSLLSTKPNFWPPQQTTHPAVKVPIVPTFAMANRVDCNFWMIILESNKYV